MRKEARIVRKLFFAKLSTILLSWDKVMRKNEILSDFVKNIISTFKNKEADYEKLFSMAGFEINLVNIDKVVWPT